MREVYQDAEAELDGVIAAGRAEQRRALAAIADKLPKGGLDDALVVVNPSLSARPLRLTLDDGAFVAADAIDPAAGVTVVGRAALAPPAGLSIDKRRLENATLRVEIGDDGTIASLVHKPTRREALAGRGNQLWLYPQDKPRAWDAWDVEEDYAARGEEWRAVDSIAIVENNPHRVALQGRAQLARVAHRPDLRACRQRPPARRRHFPRLARPARAVALA